MAGRLGFQDAREYGLVKSELLLDHLRGQADLPADMALTGGHPTVDKRKLDAIGIIQRKPVKIGLREELATQAGEPEVVDRSCKVDCHSKDQAGSTGSRSSLHKGPFFSPCKLVFLAT